MALLSNQDSTVLRHLRALGVRIAMDDFGTGHSSLSYLRSFPFDKIKIDRSFVHDLASKKDCRAIISAVSQLAISLEIETTARELRRRGTRLHQAVRLHRGTRTLFWQGQARKRR